MRQKFKKPHKYRAHKTVIDDIKFDSKAEAEYYLHLKLLKRVGEIKDFKLQPKYLLQEKFKKRGKTFRAIEYIADFEIEHNDGTIETVDVKGMETKDFKLKRKLFEKKYPQKLTLIKRKGSGWEELS
ncbi:DUF1064 domain-containing protein [Piscibacillus sp. B03]|uniref:DUF1064 domain-containing protein n=1 Tax=Piscibacillus sp. B03 TaxID=3457430 RepID=UPI003FCE8491